MTEEMTEQDKRNYREYQRLVNQFRESPVPGVSKRNYILGIMGDRYESVRKHDRIRARRYRDENAEEVNERAREFRQRNPDYNAWQQVNKRRRAKGKRPVSIQAYRRWKELSPKRKDGRVLSRR